MYVFVYGTLKRGFYNHDLLGDSEFICEATTKDQYPMVNIEKFFPYLIDDKGKGYRVVGEIYKINEPILAMLDILEGYPEHYNRKEIKVVSLGVELTAIAYFLNEKIDYSDLELLERFEE